MCKRAVGWHLQRVELVVERDAVVYLSAIRRHSHAVERAVRLPQPSLVMLYSRAPGRTRRIRVSANRLALLAVPCTAFDSWERTIPSGKIAPASAR